LRLFTEQALLTYLFNKFKKRITECYQDLICILNAA